ncbi:MULTISPECIES: hypothetical protein [unclassified Polaromonas]|uniref:hypothetical protein n=1 Tax=unclassified Polaromonas TaxID=2638319 RepID=UPI0025CD5BAC|nr:MULTISPECIES: hypothetical protein [unclassified Polaromonas]HQS00805.1 hypothetical protein [Polaromonas sp.]HQS42003.1 hypothetical protein [Polaromonas sp.]HQS87617.1 hypothetical protein [Polaromonas sp.]HQT08967.1 hypothetical protein [Polaromonas sp.]
MKFKLTGRGILPMTVMVLTLAGAYSGALMITMLASPAHASDEGHSSGKKGEGTSGHSSGGHEEGESGKEQKGFGTRAGHEGHSSGQHSVGEKQGSGGGRFGGGSGVSGSDQVPQGLVRERSNALASDSGTRARSGKGWPDIPAPPPVDPQDPVVVIVPVADPLDVTPIGSGGSPSVSAYGLLSSSMRCEGVAPNMSLAQQWSSANFRRIKLGLRQLDPKQQLNGRMDSLMVMVALQEEFGKKSPQPELLGTYLGLMAQTLVTPELIKQMAFELCAVLPESEMPEIARIANVQREKLLVSAVVR